MNIFKQRLLNVGLCGLLLGASLPSCTNDLPHSGPTERQVFKQQKDRHRNTINYAIVPLSSTVIDVMDHAQKYLSPDDCFPESFVNNTSKYDNDELHPGDVIQISIYEMGNSVFSGGVQNSQNQTSISQALNSGSTGGASGASQTGNLIMNNGNADLKSSPGATLINMPPIIVSRFGTINVPYIGEIAVEGETTIAVEMHLKQILRRKSQNPAVMIRYIQNISNTVTVYGDVNQQGRVILTPKRERLMDVIALAKGLNPKHQTADDMVRVTRGDEVSMIPLWVPATYPRQNIIMEPGDRVHILGKPRTYMTFGGAGKINEIPFSTQSMTVAQAISRAQGANDNKSNPKGVFLFRWEQNDVVKNLGIFTRKNHDTTPIVYKLDLMNPAQYLLAAHMPLKNRDMILFSNANTVELSKLLQMVNTITQPAESAGYMMR